MALRKVREWEQSAQTGARLSIATFFLFLSFFLFVLQHILIAFSIFAEQDTHVLMQPLWFCVQPLPVLLETATRAFLQAVSLILLNGAFWHVHKPAFACLIYRLQLQVYPNSLTMLAGANSHTESK